VHALLADSPAATADYRRQARRIRASFARDPFLRQMALSALASRHDEQTKAQVFQQVAPRFSAKVTVARQTDSAASPLSRPSITQLEQAFSDQASACLQPFGFTFSDRVRLLDSAERMGLPRFRANMLLAMREHQAPVRTSAAPEIPSRSFAPSLLVIFAIEVVVVAGLVALCAW
jgi:hypothetical protein